MPRAIKPPHLDTLEAVLPHFNGAYRLRFHLPEMTEPYLRKQFPRIDELLLGATEVRVEHGIADASCAMLARLVLSVTPQFAIGVLLGDVVDMTPSGQEDPEAYQGWWVLLVNPLGGRDNWASVTRAFRKYGFRDSRRKALAERSSVSRPDEDENLALLRSAAATHGRAIVLPPDEGLSIAGAAEVAYIYGTTVDTIRGWNEDYRAEVTRRRPGRPRKKTGE